MLKACHGSRGLVNILLRRGAVAHNSPSNRSSCFEVEIKREILLAARCCTVDADAVIEGGEFGRLAKKKGVTVFKLPPELRLPKEKDEDEIRKPRYFSKNTPHWYFLQCKRLAKEGKWEECLQFFEQKMLKEDRVFPEEENYSVVIGALGRKGQVKKAFQLYRQMRQRAIQPSMALYTGLFNAVAENHDSKELRKAIGLYMKLQRDKARISRITYNSLIKVFGRHGTTEQMMGIFRQSIKAGFEPDAQTFNMILLSLQKDQESGFRHVMEIWRQMLMLDVRPDGKSLTYLLKILKKCGIGNPEVAYRKLVRDVPDPAEYKDFFKTHIRNVYWLKGQQSSPRTAQNDQLSPEPEILTIDPGLVEEEIQEANLFHDRLAVDSDDICEKSNAKNLTATGDEDGWQMRRLMSDVVDTTVSLAPDKVAPGPNLLLPTDKKSFNGRDHSLALINIRNCNLPHHRLSLIGGYQYILDVMEQFNITPTVMVLSSLIEAMPPSRRAENEVIEYAEKHKVQLDADFFNAVLRKRVGRSHYQVQEILKKMVAIGMPPNYRTWCIAALSCRNGAFGVTLINDAKNSNAELDHIFFNSLLTTTLRNKSTPIKGYEDVTGCDYRYLTRILQEMKGLGIKADRQMITLLEEASDWPEGYDRWKLADQEFERKVFNFRRQYERWLNETEIREDS